MRLQLDVTFPSYTNKVKLGDQLILLGSCFSSNMKGYFQRSGLSVISNPFGVIFHPMAIHRLIDSAINNDVETRVLQRDGIFLSWDASGEIWEHTQEDLNAKLLSLRDQLRNELSKKEAKLILTYGTAFGYEYLKEEEIVANCHKVNASEFRKRLFSVEEMVLAWKKLIDQLKSFNPSICIYTSVSPVRHAKDGLRENNLSKGRLLELTRELESIGVEYIPAYELIIDELRDYRFFEQDLVHPNQTAKDILWERLEQSLLHPDDIGVFREAQQYHRQLSHRSLYTNTQADNQRLKKLEEDGEDLLSKYSQIRLYKKGEV